MPEENAIPEGLAEWVEVLRGRFGLAPEDVPIGRILALASDAAHGVTRPAAPVSAFIAGLVAGRTGGDDVAAAEAIAAIRALATSWSPGDGEPDRAGPDGIGPKGSGD